jgi:hypothetical protein
VTTCLERQHANVLRSAGDFAGLVADEDAVDDGADGGFFVGVEVGDGLEAELLAVGGVFVGLEDELIGVGVEREGESSDDVEGGLCCALFVAADHGGRFGWKTRGVDGRRPLDHIAHDITHGITHRMSHDVTTSSTTLPSGSASQKHASAILGFRRLPVTDLTGAVKRVCPVHVRVRV